MSEHWYSLSETTRRLVAGQWATVGFTSAFALGLVAGNALGLLFIAAYVILHR